MAKRKNRKRPVSPGVTLGRDLKQAELSATTFQGDHSDMPYGNFLDPAVGAKVVEENLPLKLFFKDPEKVAKWSQQVRAIEATAKKLNSGDVT